ncbi:DUF3710 domain-containing protein [Calidifontibacter terrae]
MAIFRRKQTDEPVEETAAPETVEVDDTAETTDEVVEADATAEEPAADDDATPAAPAARLDSRSVDRSNGPFDLSEVDDLEGRIDFGAIAIAPVPDMELRLDVDESGAEITGLTAIVGESACQVQAFAAPKSRGVWDAIRGEIHDNLLSGGSTASEEVGPLGVELHVRMAARGADGRTTYSPATFVGVDGPRWFLRAVLSGRAATESDARDTMLELVRGMVVNRGGEARAPREMLPLKVPDSVQTAEELPTADQAEADHDHQLPDPFERGPEITEIR